MDKSNYMKSIKKNSELSCYKWN